MTRTFRFLAGAIVGAALGLAQSPAPTVANILDNAIRGAERDVVPLVEAMPADKFDFAPSSGEFAKVRTFAQQAKHIAFVNFAVASAALGEKNPSTSGPDENGPTDIKTKDQIVKYLKDSFALAHKAAQSVTAANSTEMMPSPFGSGKMAKMAAVNVAAWHTFDHYGQMVVYARMNGVVPPASRQ